MREELNFKGLWHLPNLKDRKIAGILTFKPELESKLELIGTLEEPKKKFLEPDNGPYYEVILGLLENGDTISLIDCYRTNYKANFKVNISTASYNVRIILSNLGLENRSSKLFNKISFHINIFPQWMRTNIINQKLFYQGEKIDGFELKFLKSKDQDIYKFDTAKDFSIEFSSFASYREVNYSGYELFSSFSIIINSSESNSLSYFLEKSNRFISFLRCCFSDYVFFTNFYFHVETLKENRYEHPWKRCVFKQKYFKNKIDRSSYMKISFIDIEEKINGILSSWMNLNKQIDPIIETLIELNERGREFTIKDFLAITQCVDGFHRMFKNSKQMPFVKRIKKLYYELMSINIIDFSEGEIKRIVDNRDYYTHLHQDKGVDFFTIPELFQKTRKLYALVLFSLLKEVGFTEEMLRKYGEDDYLN